MSTTWTDLQKPFFGFHYIAATLAGGVGGGSKPPPYKGRGLQGSGNLSPTSGTENARDGKHKGRETQGTGNARDGKPVPYELQLSAMRGIIPAQCRGRVFCPKIEVFSMKKILFVCHGMI